MSDVSAETLVDKATAKGTFKFAEVLKGRGYPTDEVTVWLDEKTAYPLLEIDVEAQKIHRKISLLPDDEERNSAEAALSAELDKLEEKRKQIAEKLTESRYVFTLKGISPGTAEDMQELATAEYPIEYETYFNEVTGQRIKEPVSNTVRDRYFTNLLWQAHIVKITDSEGNEDFMPDLETVGAARRAMPRAATQALADTMDKLDMSVNWFEAVVDEGFLAKS